MTETRARYDVDQVRERTDLLALIGQHVALKKRGGRFVGLCPFHQEKTPSFGVDPQKGFWHCFGCGKGGDAFTFMMEMEKLPFGEALERLAERAGVRPLVEYADAPKRLEERDLLLEVNGAAAAAFQRALKGPTGAAARAYLTARGITPEHAERFGIGYAPAQWDALAGHLCKRGYAVEMLVKAGVVLQRSRGEGYIDRFRNRVMIPIHDRRGHVVAFGGRALTAEDQPKYLNTAETPVFHKSSTLYALHLASQSMVGKSRAIVTEGYFDTIACHLAGFTETVATLGTALGEEHVQMLRRLAERVYLVFDADSAGVNAALRSQSLFRAAGVDVRIVRLPAGHDPDTLLREQGAEGFERCLAAALSPVEFELQQLGAAVAPDDAEARIRLFRAAAKILQPLSPLERAEYAARIIARWTGDAREDVSRWQQALLGEVQALDRQQRPATPHAAPSTTSGEPPLEREALTAMVQMPEVATLGVSLVLPEAFTHSGYRAIFSALAAQAARGETPDARRLVSEDDTLAATVAALAVRDLLPVEDLSPESMLHRLCDEYEKRQLVRPIDHLEETEEDARAWMERVREQKRKAKRQIFGAVD